MFNTNNDFDFNFGNEDFCMDSLTTPDNDDFNIDDLFNDAETETDDSALESALFNDDVVLTPADESYIFLEALRSECTPEEFNELAIESATELELYGLIDSADSAMEGQRNIVKLNKFATLSSVQKRTAIRIGARKNDPDYKIYKKHRDAMIKAREKLFTKFASQSKSEAKKIMTNSKHKASAMSTPKGKSIADKMDKAIKKVDKNIRNHSAIKK